ncbi:hypothetical protein FRC02_004838 [Tulasnella sp. 418]|nr:hypothetical protein FRC02_004838 [Tulasnella sp. 418]
MASTTDFLWYLSTAVVGCATIPALGKLFRSKVLVPRYCAVQDLEQAGKPRSKPKLKGQAVICGGSVAGLLAAAVAIDHYESVLIIEAEENLIDSGSNWKFDDGIRLSPDGVPIHVNPRSRVKQYTSTHAYMPMCFRTLRHLFPSYQEEIEKLGLEERFHDTKFHVAGFPLLGAFDDGPDTSVLWVTRGTLEPLIRKLVLQDKPGIQFAEGTVTGFQRSNDGKSIDELNWRNPKGATLAIQNPSLVIDATGTTQAGFKWLSKAGFDIPAGLRAQYQVPLHYVTTLLRVPPHLRGKLPLENSWDETDWIYVYLPDFSKETGILSIGIVDRDKILICCGGWGDLPRPHSIPEIKQYVHNLQAQRPIDARIFELLDFFEEHVDELNPTYTDASQDICSYIQYHTLAASLPSNFVAIGDSILQLNPIFGQGVTLTAIEALTLDSILRQTDTSNLYDISARFFKLLAGRLDYAWNSTKDTDYLLPFTIPVEGEDKSIRRLARWYSGAVMKLAFRDPSVADSLAKIRGFAVPQTDLLAPSILARVLWMGLTNQ